MGFLLALGTALWLGLLTSISPCPLATNLAAVSFISKEVKHPWRTIVTGLLYALGRSLAYMLLAALIIRGLLEVPVLAVFLQNAMNRIMGPLLVLVGLFLLGLIRVPSFGSGLSVRLGERVSRMGMAGALLLGAVFALSFCPVSAALFFGSMIPMSIEHHSVLTIPLAYGVGTGLPVLALAWVLLGGMATAARWSRRFSDVERPACLITAVTFLLAGVYYIYNFLLSRAGGVY